MSAVAATHLDPYLRQHTVLDVFSSPATSATGMTPGRSRSIALRPETGVSAHGLTLTTTTIGRSARGTIRKAAASARPSSGHSWWQWESMNVSTTGCPRSEVSEKSRSDWSGSEKSGARLNPAGQTAWPWIWASGCPCPPLLLVSRCTSIPSRTPANAAIARAAAAMRRLTRRAFILSPAGRAGCSRVPSCGRPVPNQHDEHYDERKHRGEDGGEARPAGGREQLG